MGGFATFIITWAGIWYVQNIAEALILMSQRRDAARWAAKAKGEL